MCKFLLIRSADVEPAHLVDIELAAALPENWKNLLGNIKQSAVFWRLHSLKLWRRFIMETPSQWEGLEIRVALYAHSSGCLAHYCTLGFVAPAESQQREVL